MNAREPLVVLRGLYKSYFMNERRIDVLRGASLELQAGELASLVGASGSGKSTLLHIVGTLDTAAAGEMWYAGQSVFELSDAELAEFRNRNVGFVFQSHYLLPEFTALENVLMPALVRRHSTAESREWAEHLLEEVGLVNRMSHRPGELSGGESQRVALARALMMKPALLLADEPTGNLDPQSGDGILSFLRSMNRQLNMTAMIVTHNEQLAAALPRRLRLIDGNIRDLAAPVSRIDAAEAQAANPL